jgi:hypothetical protein
MAKKRKLGTILPADTFFYTIQFEQSGQNLTRELLAKHFPVPNGRKAYMGNHAEYTSFKNGLVTVQVKSPDNSENMLFLHVGLTELDVACTCGMPNGKLCYHAYMGLHSLAWNESLELERYYWPGLTADDKIKDKFLSTEVTKNWIRVKPKDKFGNIFKSTIRFEDDNLPSVEKPAKIASIVKGNQEAMAYCLAYNVGFHSNIHLPVLIPCLGLTSKYNNEIVSFNRFHRQDKPINEIVYNDNQQQLNKISFKQYDIAKRYDDLPGEEKKQELAQAKQSVLTLWEQAIPLLFNEKYNYRYYTYWIKYLKDKPRKTDMRGCSYSLERPVLSFFLKFHLDHFSLSAVVSVNNNALKFKHKPQLFVFDDITELCYLMPSVQDDDLLRWMLSNNNRLTILKDHFVEFYNVFLEKLSSYYTVLFTDPKTKKAAPYSYDFVLNELIK